MQTVKIAAYLLLTALTYYLAGMYSVPALMVLFFVELGLFFFLLILPWCLVWGLQVQVETQGELTQKGVPAKGQICVKNRLPLPIPSYQITLSYRNSELLQWEELVLSGSVGARGIAKTAFQLTSAYCGKLTLRVKELWVRDYLAMFFGWKKNLATVEFVVLPTHREMDIRVGESRQGSVALAPEDKVPIQGAEPSDYELREYRQGDSMKNIHWKLYARTDGLPTRVFHGEEEYRVSVFLDLRRAFHRDILWTDAFLELSSSVSLGLLGRGVPHRVYWYDRERGRLEEHPVAGREDWVRMMVDLYDTKDSFRQEAHEEDFLGEIGKILGEPLLVLGTDLKLFLSQGEECRFTKENYVQELEEKWMRI